MSPYRNPIHATRFYGLGAVGNPGKVKSTVALAVTPTAALTLAAAETGADEGAGATPCPYTASKPKPAAGAAAAAAAADGPRARPADQPLKHEELPGGEWKCAVCGNVNRAHQREKCNMKKCGVPRHGSIEMFQLQNMSSFHARGAKRDADGLIVESLGGVAGAKVYSMMSREQAEAEAAAATEAAAEAAAAAAAGGGGGGRQKKEARPSLYAAQKPMTGKQKSQKGTSNPGAWR